MKEDEENFVIDMPSYNHSIVQSNLAAAFRVKYRNEYRALTQPTILLEDWESEPDVAIFPKRPVIWHKDEVKIKEIPLIVIEIISPRQAQQDIMMKLEKYFNAGVESCWLINPLTAMVSVYNQDWKRTVYADMNAEIQDAVSDISIDFEEIFS